MSRKLIKKVVKAVFPTTTFEKLQAVRSRRFQMRILTEDGHLEATKRYIERHGCTVRYGPFANMIYPLEAAMTRLSIAKLLGTYEQELHSVLATVAGRKYDIVIDIGSAEGYYAVGLARMLKTTVLAYDPEPYERNFCQQAAELNGVSDLVQMQDLFFATDISRFAGKRVLCLCDCEGFEANIFTQESLSGVADWDIIIELHGAAKDKLTSLDWPNKPVEIETGFERAPYKELAGLGEPKKLLSEGRSGPQTWLWCDAGSARSY